MRIKNREGEVSPKIDRKSVLGFFERRAERVGELGPTRAVIYQDKTPDLAERRDAAEKSLLLPKLALTPKSRLLDVGCGTGRWAEVIIPACGRYVGSDFSPGLVKVASERFRAEENASFAVCASDQLALEALGEPTPFTHVLVSGVLIYLNDEEVFSTLGKLGEVASDTCRILIREPVGLQERLTIKEHYSEELEQEYNAIYRTEREILKALDATLGRVGFVVVDSGDVYSEPQLNNRSDTRQRWYLLRRGTE